MVKHFNVIMAAVISGTVALFTSVLGVSGTVIGSVVSTFLYQLLSGYSEEKYEEGSIGKPSLANELVYIFPLVVIAIIELIFVFSALHYKFDMLFDILESAVSNNLFRLMGLGLILLGAYPFFNSNDIDKRNGLVILIVGVLLLLRGLMDITDMTYQVFCMFFAPFDMLFALFVVVAIVVVIFNILIGSDKVFSKSNDFINNHSPKKPNARKIDTSLIDDNLSDEGVKTFDNSNNDSKDYNLDSNNLNSNLDNNSDSNLNSNSNNKNDNFDNQENLPLYEEEIILVTNPEDPENPIKKRILKRVDKDKGSNDDYQDVYVLDEL